MQFKPAVKSQLKARLALSGPSGSGKTYTALRIARLLSDKIAVIDTENDSASRFADEFTFDTLNLRSPTIGQYCEAMTAAASSGYGALLVDSMSHAWEWAKSEVDRITAQTRASNSYTSWAKVTPEWQRLIDFILHSRVHLIACFRSKQDYVLEDVERNGRTIKVPRKVGMAPITRDNTDYEFDAWCELEMDHRLIVGKTRCRALDGKVFTKDQTDVFTDTFKNWLEAGAVPAADPEPPKGEPKAPSAKPEESREWGILKAELDKVGCREGDKESAKKAIAYLGEGKYTLGQCYADPVAAKAIIDAIDFARTTMGMSDSDIAEKAALVAAGAPA